MRRFIALILPTGLLLACGGGDDPYPTLIPLEEVTARAATLQTDAGTPDAVAARAADLRARAAALRGPVIDPATRARLIPPR